MRTKNFDFLDIEKSKPLYSFKVLHEKTWKNVAENGKPLLFETEESRNLKRAEYRKM